ncbi:hypothetical protein DV515_00005562 [Chloebia gouldiae]|uniref:Uncharacterized protein n=1 Tax=Chloebia gouldiae TaxID=44316 RepID=A0A3L8SPS0_CHLGU|nr:hypothetical protein DV515_00005562 [Chloebia gouldiae]
MLAGHKPPPFPRVTQLCQARHGRLLVTPGWESSEEHGDGEPAPKAQEHRAQGSLLGSTGGTERSGRSLQCPLLWCTLTGPSMRQGWRECQILCRGVTCE